MSENWEIRKKKKKKKFASFTSVLLTTYPIQRAWGARAAAVWEPWESQSFRPVANLNPKLNQTHVGRTCKVTIERPLSQPSMKKINQHCLSVLWHGGAVVRTGTSRQEGSGFKFRLGPFRVDCACSPCPCVSKNMLSVRLSDDSKLTIGVCVSRVYPVSCPPLPPAIG